MVILIRLYAFYFCSLRLVTYITFTTSRRFTYLQGLMVMFVAHCRVAVGLEGFLAAAVVRMISATASPACFQVSGTVTLAIFFADAAVRMLCSLS